MSVLDGYARKECLVRCSNYLSGGQPEAGGGLSPGVPSTSIPTELNSQVYDALMPYCVVSCNEQTLDCDDVCLLDHTKPHLACVLGCTIGRSMLATPPGSSI